MCVGGTPKAPAMPAPRQAPRTPDAVVTSDQTRADLLRRNTMASMIFTGPGGALTPATTAGKAVLGA